MIVLTADLPSLRGVVAMADGGFDPLHAGHLAYFEQAATLGLPLLVNVAPDAWVERKHPVLLPQAERGRLIDSLRPVAYVHLATGKTDEVLRLLQPPRYVKGSDWRGRLPADELATCAEHGIEIVYVGSVLDSSSEILRRWQERARNA